MRAKSAVNAVSSKKSQNTTLLNGVIIILPNVRLALKRNGESKTLLNLLGYTMAELRAHLEGQFTQGMTWERFCNGEIHIDHRYPKSKYNMQCTIELRSCWSLANLRPMWAVDNLKKRDRVECAKVWIDRAELQGDMWDAV